MRSSHVRVCYKCRKPDGVGLRELRPYGPKRAGVCAECVFGNDGSYLLKLGPQVTRSRRSKMIVVASLIVTASLAIAAASVREMYVARDEANEMRLETIRLQKQLYMRHSWPGDASNSKFDVDCLNKGVDCQSVWYDEYGSVVRTRTVVGHGDKYVEERDDFMKWSGRK